MENQVLQHHGTKGMKWGIRRYQNPDGSLTAAGRKRYKVDSDGNLVKKKKISRKVRKQREAALEKARQTRADKKDYEEKKQKALKSGSAKDVLKYKGDLTQQEMQSALSRIQWEQNMNNLVANGKQSRLDKGKKFAENVLNKSGENLMTQVANHYGAKALNKIINKIDKTEGIEVIFANNKKK